MKRFILLIALSFGFIASVSASSNSVVLCTDTDVGYVIPSNDLSNVNTCEFVAAQSSFNPDVNVFENQTSDYFIVRQTKPELRICSWCSESNSDINTTLSFAKTKTSLRSSLDYFEDHPSILTV